jgi:hypothetical protein
VIKPQILFFFLLTPILTQDVNIDSLKRLEEIGVFEKVSLTTVQHWQKLSYNHKFLNCQFYPSCSNYFALSIANKGTLKGCVYGIDRFIRCNPGAVNYHFRQTNPLFHTDGRIIDLETLNEDNKKFKFKKWPIYLSIIPGLGRACYGREIDGTVSFIYTAGSLIFSHYSFKKGNNFVGGLSGITSLLFWSADIYFTVKLANR